MKARKWNTKKFDQSKLNNTNCECPSLKTISSNSWTSLIRDCRLPCSSLMSNELSRFLLANKQLNLCIMLPAVIPIQTIISIGNMSVTLAQFYSPRWLHNRFRIPFHANWLAFGDHSLSLQST